MRLFIIKNSPVTILIIYISDYSISQTPKQIVSIIIADSLFAMIIIHIRLFRFLNDYVLIAKLSIISHTYFNGLNPVFRYSNLMLFHGLCYVVRQ